MPEWKKVESPMTAAMRWFGRPALRMPMAAPMAAPMQMQVSIAASGGADPSV